MGNSFELGTYTDIWGSFMAPLDNYASSRFTPHLSGSSRHHLRRVRQSRLLYCGGVAGQVGIIRVSAAKVGIIRVSAAKVGIRRVHAAKVGIRRVHAAKVGIRRVSAANAAPTPAIYLSRILVASLPVREQQYIY